MVWAQNQQVLLLGSGRTTKRWRLACVAAFAFWCFLIFLTPKISPSHHLHTFADMRNFFGVPNTLNVMTNFPFLVVGVLGFVLCLQGGFLISVFQERFWDGFSFMLGQFVWLFGSAYYHLKPDDTRIIWDYLPMMVAYPSLLSTLIIERMGQRVGLSCLFALLLGAFSSIAYERTFNDLRLCMTFQLIPCIAIPVMAIMIPPKYTYSSYWIWAAALTDTFLAGTPWSTYVQLWLLFFSLICSFIETSDFKAFFFFVCGVADYFNSYGFQVFMGRTTFAFLLIGKLLKRINGSTKVPIAQCVTFAYENMT